MDNLQKIYLSKLSVVEHSGGYLNVPAGAKWESFESVSDYDMVYYIKEGNCTFIIDEKKYDGIPGREFFIPAGTLFSYCNNKDSKFVVNWIQMKLYPNNVNILKFLGLPYFVDITDYLIAERSFEDFFRTEKGHRVVDKLHLKSFVYQMIFRYIINADCDTVYVDRGKDEIIYRVIDFIDKNIEMNPSNSDLARICHLHPNNFIRFFKKKTGHTPARYIKLKKMEKAKKLIEETDLSFNEIMRYVGYDDAAHFSKSFKSVYGNVPRLYRQNVKNKYSESV